MTRPSAYRRRGRRCDRGAELRAELHRLAAKVRLQDRERSFMDALGGEIDRSVGEGSPLSVAILNIDQFDVNDTPVMTWVTSF